MIRKYVYDGKAYRTPYSVKQAIFDKERTVFSAEPKENKAEFWAQYGVTYTEEPDPEPTLEQAKAQKLSELETAFLSWYESDAKMISSLGYECDCDARAMMDVSGLVTVAEATEASSYSTAFMDANNQPHLVELEQLKTLQLEIIAAGQAAYQEKWALRSAIEAAKAVNAVQGIEIKFRKQDFSNAAS